MSTLKSLVASAPSGRARPVLLDHPAYARAVICQGSALPWSDIAALTGHQGQVHALLNPDVTWLDVEAIHAALLADNPDLVTAMGARTRTGYALRTLLADEESLEFVFKAAATVAESNRRPLVVSVPSPARWLGRAHAVAGTDVEEVDADRADTASMYVAEWLGKLGGLPVALVLLDARPVDGDPAADTEELTEYTSILNVAEHLGWVVALRTETSVQVSDGTQVGVIPEEFWTDGADLPGGEALLGAIPATASPERVLERLQLLG